MAQLSRNSTLGVLRSCATWRNLDSMSQQSAGRVPEFTLGDRLQKARETLGLNTRDFAELIGVSQKTVTDAENDHRRPRRIMLNAWSLATGVSRQWLETGEAPANDDGGPKYTTRDSNPEPAVYIEPLVARVIPIDFHPTNQPLRIAS
jgi:transcriptional regulator with XRE-family HTH domain